MIYVYIAVMAIVTYLIRMIPLTAFRKKIKNVPYTCLTAMTLPAVFYATGSLLSAAAGMVVAVVLALKERGLVAVAAGACVTVFVAEWLVHILA